MRLFTNVLMISLLAVMTLMVGCGGGGGGGGAEYTLNIACEGYGRVTDTSGYAIVTRKIPAGTGITLVPVGETGGWVFSNWGGQNGTEVTDNTIIMNGDKSITAVFSHLTCSVNITVVGQGTVSQELVVGALSLPTYKGDKVRLVPAPVPDWDLDHWEGDINTNLFAPEIIVDSNKSIIAVFTPVITYGSFNEDAENLSPMVRPEGTWAKTTSSGHNSTYSWTDSPNGNYNAITDMSLTTRAINMNGSQDPYLVFWHHYDVDHYNCNVEISTDFGVNWTSLKSYTGTRNPWTQEIISLNAYKSQSSILIRFRLRSQYDPTKDGWYIDDISIEERNLISNYYDDAEIGSSFMNSDGIWGKTNTKYHSTSNSWADSPIGNYSSNTDASLTSSLINLTGTSNPCLFFWHQYEIAYGSGNDYGWIEISVDGGIHWSQLKSYRGWDSNWKQEIISLNDYKGQSNIKIRFRLINNGPSTEDGWYVDDIGIYDFQ